MRRPLLPPDPTAVRRLVDTAVALAANPDRTNVARYLAASKALEESRSPIRTLARRAA